MDKQDYLDVWRHYLDFLMTVLGATEESKGNPALLYLLLQAHLDLLNENFIIVLQKWAEATLPKVEPLKAEYIARIIGEFSNLIANFPLANQMTKEIRIVGYEICLTVFTRPTHPEMWANTQTNLGAAYRNRISNDKAENIKKAIEAYELALEVYTKKDFPIQWAITQNNLGIAYRSKISGNRARNIKKGIKAHKLALQVRTENDFPIQWAMTQNNLGAAYTEIVLYDKPENIEKAIEAYQRALQVYTKKDFPIQWAMTRSNLGVAFAKDKKFEKAIEAYELALEVYTKKHFPLDWAMTQNNLGTGYWNRISGDRSENMKMAIASYQKALQVYTPKTDPLNCLNTACGLGNLHFNQSNWQDAIDAYKKAIKSVELSRSWATTDDRRQQILTEAIDVYANIIQCFVNLQQYDQAVEYADRSRSRLLVELMASKDLYPDAETPPEVEEYLQLQRQLDRLRHPPESGGMGELSKSPYHRDDTGKLQEQKIDKIKELERRKKQLWEQIRKTDPVLAGQLQVDPLKIEDIQQLIENERTAILNFYTTNEDTYIFVLRQNSTSVHTCQGQGIETLQLWMRQNWLIPYLSNREQWRDQIGPFLSELAQRLQLQQLIDQNLADIEELVIVPHLFLHQIPFAALPIANSIPAADSNSAIDATRGMIFSSKRPPAKKPKPAPTPKPTYLSDKYRLRVIPSCQILSYCHENKNKKQKKIPPSPQMGIVENATNDLPFSGYECQAIAKTYGVPENLHLKGDRATPTNYRHLAQQVQLLHSSHHAEADLNDPLNSKLRLADGEVTLGEIFTWRLPDLLEVFLACCETNFTPQTTPADDILVIAAGWLSAGALNVVSTLWAVDDCATALFSILYYEQRQQQPTLERSEALRRAQFQLRNLTGEEFKTQYRAPLEEYLRQIGKNRDLEWYCNLQNPFESPRYWAAFVSQGMN